jgi:hypothetical protein
LACLPQPVAPNQILPHPTGRRRLHPWPLWVGQRCLMVVERLAAAVCQGRRDPPTHRHHHPQRPAALGLFARERRGETRRGCHKSAPAFRLLLALGAWPHLLRGPWGLVPCVGGQEETTGRVDEGGAGRQRGGQGPRERVAPLVGVRGSPRASPFARARLRAPRAGGQDGGRPTRLQGGQGLTRLRCARQGGAASELAGWHLLGTRLAPRLVHGGRGGSLTGRGGEEDPALLHAAVARGHLGIARARLVGGQGLRLGVGQGGVGGAPGCRPPGTPLARRRGELGAVGRALAGPVSPPGGDARRGGPGLEGGPAPRAARGGSPAVAPARWPPEGEPGLRLHKALPPDWAEVRTLSAPKALQDVYHLGRGRLLAAGAPRDMPARRGEGRLSGPQAQPLGGPHRPAAGECGHSRGLEGLPGTTERLIVERCGSNAGRQESGGGLLREAPGDEGERGMAHPQAIEPQRCDGFPHGAVSPCRVLAGRLVDDVAHAKCVEQACDQAEVIQDWTTVQGWGGLTISSDGEELVKDL